MSEMPITPEVPEDGPIDNRYLSDQFMEMVFFIERFHATQGNAPTDEIMHKRFEIEQKDLEDFKVNPLVQKSLKYRGIVYPNPSDMLTDKQMAAIAAMLNYTDRRSDEKKLRDIGITTREWHTWLLDDNFAAYLSDRSERLLTASQHEAHLGLIKGMRSGNVAHVKLFNEMTGRYNPEAENNFNIKILLGTFIEILQRNISDPVVLHRIALEMNNAAARQTMGGAEGPSGRFAPTQKQIAMKGEVI
jgi:hypothetical protein